MVNLLQPPTVKAVAALCVVRNSIGENSYVADEVITAKSGVRVRVTNTDEDGHLTMADALYHMKEMALCSVNPHLFTVATLTAHAILTVGRGYSVSRSKIDDLENFFCYEINCYICSFFLFFLLFFCYNELLHTFILYFAADRHGQRSGAFGQQRREASGFRRDNGRSVRDIENTKRGFPLPRRSNGR